MRADRQVPLVLGAEGLIGRAVSAALERTLSDTVSAGRAEIDVTDRARVEMEIERLRPTLVVNCASLDDPEVCEIEPDRAAWVNAEGAANVARAAAAIGARMVHFSSTAVFDRGSNHPYREADRPSPLGVHGRTRLEGEQGVASHAGDHLILRTSWPYGKGRPNFVDAIHRQIADGGVLRAVSDRTGSPTWTADLADALLRLLDRRHRGIVHFSNAGSCSRYDVAAAMVASLDAGGVHLQRVPADAVGGFARRPAHEEVDTALYAGLTGHAPRDWREALQTYLHDQHGDSDRG